MKKTLLPAPSNAILIRKRSLFTVLLLVFSFWIGSLQNTNAQCVAPVQKYQSVDTDANMTTLDWSKNLFVVSSVAGNARSGTKSYFFNWTTTANGPATIPFVVTQQLPNISTFSFWLKKVGTAASYKVELTNNNGTNWYDLSNSTDLTTLGMVPANVTLPALTTTYSNVIVNIPSSLANVRFRISDTRNLAPAAGVTGGLLLDDFSWTSYDSTLNTEIVPLVSSAVTCTVIVPSGTSYTYYDVGGDHDTYRTSQNNNIVFTPSNSTDKIKVTFLDFNTEATNDYVKLFNDPTFTTQVGSNYSGATLPPTFTSTFSNGSVSLNFTSDSNAVGAGQLGFKIKIECVGCPAPGSLAFSGSGAVSHDSAFLTWSGTASNYEVYYNTTGALPNGSTVANGGSSAVTSATVTGLSSSTLYYFWVRSDCGAGGKSTWTGPISTTTLCAPQTVVYVENFNGLLGGVLPTCTKTDGSFASNNTNGNIFANGIGDSFFTQGVTLTAGTLYRITYDYSTNLNGYASLEVFMGRPTNNTVATVSNINQSIAYNGFFSVINSNIVNYTPAVTGTYYLRFFVDDLESGSVQLNLDNIRIEIETCLPPTALTVAASPPVNDFGATLSWTAPSTGAPSGGYSYFISTTNVPPTYNDAGTGTVASNGITFTTLSPNTTYYVWVRANCGGLISIWSTTFATFTTTNITSPTTIRISDLPGTTNVTCGANITFTDSGGTAGSYLNNEKTGSPSYDPYSYTFIPVTPGAKLMVIFNSFSTENNWDGLMIYSGTSSAGTLMPSGRAPGFLAQTCPANAWSGTTSPGSILSTAADGSLTFQFRSDSSVTSAGWTASIVCVSNVPTITSFTPSTNNCTPGVSVVITGTNFVGITSVTFGGVAATFVVNSSTQITATLPASAASGKIKISTAQLSVTSATDFTVLAPPPTTTGVTICTGASGTISSSTSCNGYSNAVVSNSFPGAWVVGTDPVAPKPQGSANSTTCAFTGTNQTYSSINFQVNITGTYVFELASGVDAMAYITTGAFTPGSCATGTFVIGDDDSGAGLEPRLTVTLTAGVTYTIYATFYSTSVSGPYTWSVTPPSGGNVLLFQSQAIQWYTAAIGGSPIGSGSPFNPVGVAGSGITNTNTPGTWTFYAACSSNSTCRTATTFVVGGAVAGTASSDQNICSGTASALTLTGNTGSVVEWQYANDLAFTLGVTSIPTSNSTTLTSLQIGTFTGTRYFRAVVNLPGCTNVNSNVVTISFNKTIWNGSTWSNGAPDSTKGAEFQGNFTSSINAGPTGNVSACSVLVTSGTVLFDIGTLTVQNDVNVAAGTLTFEDKASLYQVSNVANAPGVYAGGNVGNITYKRITTPLFRYDYTYWSTPVNPQNLLAVSPLSPTSLFYEYNASINNWQYIDPTSTTMTVGKGYIFRAPSNYPTGFPSAPQLYMASFFGVPNNGTFTIPVVGGASQLNLIGNPYPSALSADAFLVDAANAATLSGTIYLWTHNTPINASYQYTGSDYAVYNYLGGTVGGEPTQAATNPGLNNSIPNGKIASGQGFFIKGLSNGTATFKNSMRIAGNNDQFFRMSSASATVEGPEKHRYWIDIANTEGGFKQVLVGYVDGATSGLDRLFDGEMVDVGNVVTLYTLADAVKLSIQGRPLPFDVNDTVPLGYKSTITGTFTIKISTFDGLFNGQNVYLEDKLLNVIHDLKESDYTFATNSGTFEDRFVLRYNTVALGVNPILNENTVVVYKNDTGLHINSGTVNMKNVTIFDVTGRKIASQKQIGNTTTVFTTLPTTQQVLLVTIEGENGGQVTKKIVF